MLKIFVMRRPVHIFADHLDPWDIRRTASAKMIGEDVYRSPHYENLEHLKSHFF